jgi:hypothetical protein
LILELPFDRLVSNVSLCLSISGILTLSVEAETLYRYIVCSNKLRVKKLIKMEIKYIGFILDSYFESNINTCNYLKPIIQKGAKNTINITNTTFITLIATQGFSGNTTTGLLNISVYLCGLFFFCLILAKK